MRITITPVPCGCVITAHDHVVKHVDWCKECQARLDEVNRLTVAILDQEIEDKIFNGQ